MNSCCGRFGLCVEKHRRTTFAKSENLYRHNQTPLLESELQLVSEYETGIYEITKKKRKTTDMIPVHISLFIYQMSKLWFFQFVMTLNEFLIPKTYRFCYIG